MTYTQPGTISKEDTSVFQKAVWHGPEVNNVVNLHQIKRNFIVLYDDLDNYSFPQLHPQHSNSVIDEKDNNGFPNEIVTTWRDELQEKIVDTTKTLKEHSNEKVKELKVYLNNTLYATLKEFYGITPREVTTMITNQLQQQMK